MVAAVRRGRSVGLAVPDIPRGHSISACRPGARSRAATATWSRINPPLPRRVEPPDTSSRRREPRMDCPPVEQIKRHAAQSKILAFGADSEGAKPRKGWNWCSSLLWRDGINSNEQRSNVIRGDVVVVLLLKTIHDLTVIK